MLLIIELSVNEECVRLHSETLESDRLIEEPRGGILGVDANFELENALNRVGVCDGRSQEGTTKSSSPEILCDIHAGQQSAMTNFHRLLPNIGDDASEFIGGKYAENALRSIFSRHHSFQDFGGGQTLFFSEAGTKCCKTLVQCPKPQVLVRRGVICIKLPDYHDSTVCLPQSDKSTSIACACRGMPFEHRSISVFSGFDQVDRFSRLTAYSASAEHLPAFQATPAS